MMEITCLVWAQGLLQLAYSFVDGILKDRGDPPFPIPRMRFVQAALAMEQDGTGVYLLEEFIGGKFRKYLNNVSAEPLQLSTVDDQNRAEFLAFTQHVQYWKTGKQVFVADYQGKCILQVEELGLNPRLQEGTSFSQTRRL
jgi:hypothetical protein